eukprot:7575993-Alexandrium_andersonii.AAC.1
MSASLVGSEMCIRDSHQLRALPRAADRPAGGPLDQGRRRGLPRAEALTAGARAGGVGRRWTGQRRAV